MVGQVHNRMPVILPDVAVDGWLLSGQSDTEALRSLLVPAPDELLVPTPVSPRVTSAKSDDPSLLEEVP